MSRNFRLVPYLLAAAILVGLMAVSPSAWATPDQTQPNQTVPTRTPKPVPPTQSPPQPTTPPPPTSAPQPTTRPATQTPAPRATPTPTATASPSPAPAAGTMSLTLAANRLPVWPGVQVVFTLALVNTSATPIEGIVLLDPLPEGLEPGAILSGAGAGWQGRSFRAEIPALAPGARYEASFEAIVSANVASGTVIVNQASAASAPGAPPASASADIALPPAELPRVGGIVNDNR